MKFLLGLLFFTTQAFSTANTTQVNVLSYSATNVATSAYTVLVAATPIPTSRLQICDTSTRLLKLAIGPAGSEKDICTVQVSGCVLVPYYIAPGVTLSIRAVDANATSGYNTVGFIP